MIPHQYLRVKIFNKGNNLVPVFCASDDEALLSSLIREYEQAAQKREKKGLLIDRIRMIEANCRDARLVRGICNLLDKRCIFASTLEQNANKLSHTQDIPNVSSKVIRKKLYEESAKRHLALSIDKRDEILQTVASRLGMDRDLLDELVWNDLDENLQLQSFFHLEPTDLIAWYNLAVVQTLLFSCTNLEFSLRGGANWKRVLRDVKRHGLMYSIRSQKSEGYTNSQHDKIVCSVEGPLSIIRMTEIYGTALAKLVPNILKSDGWSMQAWIVRKSLTQGKKVYDFQLDKNGAPVMSLPYHYSAPNIAGSDSVFDSNFEQRFATKFEQCQSGWTMTREPDPIILDGGKVFIPDFLFERQGQRVYLEIVGFWTIDYLKRKIEKLISIISGQENENCGSCDIFIAINKEYLTSSAYKDAEPELRKLRSLIRNDHLIHYERGSVPLKQILSYLRLLDRELFVRLADTFSKEILSEVDRIIGTEDDKAYLRSTGVISLSDLAARYNVPIETVNLALQRRKPGNLNSTDSNKDGTRNYLLVGPYLIRKDKIVELQASLLKVNTLSDANLIIDKLRIPIFYHIDLLSELGYDVIWNGIDANNASIRPNHDKLVNFP
jgi:uncharacterized protein